MNKSSCLINSGNSKQTKGLKKAALFTDEISRNKHLFNFHINFQVDGSMFLSLNFFKRESFEIFTNHLLKDSKQHASAISQNTFATKQTERTFAASFDFLFSLKRKIINLHDRSGANLEHLPHFNLFENRERNIPRSNADW